MPLRIAIAGKGGSGKTTLAALLCRTLIQRGLKPVLAIDADPNSCLPGRLGVTDPHTIGEMREEVRNSPESVPQGVSKHAWIEQLIQEDIAEAAGFDLLAMGRQEGPGCYCYLNNILRDSIDRLSNQYRAVIIDNEAGLEHLSRRTNGGVEVLLLICPPTQTGLQTARRIQSIVKGLELQVGTLFLVFNPCDRLPDGELASSFGQLQIPVLGNIPLDPLLGSYDVSGQSLLQLPDSSRALQVVQNFVDSLAERELL